MRLTSSRGCYYFLKPALTKCDRQLTHPLVSPILQGSLGNLPPLYIITGNDEVLRDEIIYMAHRAAHPRDYPARRGALRDARQRNNAKKYTTPTKVSVMVLCQYE